MNESFFYMGKEMKVLRLGKNEVGIINNIYHPTGKFNPESFDRVELVNCFTKKNSKFAPIVFKECFTLLKKEGILKIVYKPPLSGLTPKNVEETLWWLYQRKYIILDHSSTDNSCSLSIKKTESVLHKEEGIDFWTFGMVTNGQRKDFISQSIQSIRALKIPYYEIIICGYYEDKIGNDLKYIPFKERDDRGWITRKKNIIAENAKYTNLCIFHDRIVFDKNWFLGIKKYGNVFEVLTCPQLLHNKVRAGDWVTANKNFSNPGHRFTIEQLDYRDWDKFVYIGGQLIIMKKYVWKEVFWNENLYWREGEDIEYSHRLTEKGFIPRLNTFAKCITLSWRFGSLPKKEYPTDIWHYFQDVPLRRITRLVLYYMVQLPLLWAMVKRIYPFFSKTKLNRFLRDH